MSPLEAARAADGGGKPADAPKSTEGLSPLEAARAAGAVGGGATSEDEPAAEPAPAPEPKAAACTDFRFSHKRDLLPEVVQCPRTPWLRDNL